MKGRGMSADLGTKVDVGKGTVSCQLNVVVAVSTKGGDEEGGMVVEGVVVGDGEKEVLLDIFVLRAPDFLTSFVDDGVLVRVIGDGGGARWGDE
jgi:hypothetical protein